MCFEEGYRQFNYHDKTQTQSRRREGQKKSKAEPQVNKLDE